MKTKLLKFIYIFFVCIIACGFSCAGGDAPMPPTPVKTVGRTVLVYQVANNNLGTARYNELDIDEMREGADAGKIGDGGRLLVYNAGPSATPLLLEIKEGAVDTLKTYSTDVISVESSRMLEVLSDMEEMAPASSYGLVLWSHGSGWLQDGIEDNEDAAPLSFGSEKSKTMNITTLQRVLESGSELCFLYFDCCYMASIETLYQLRHCAPVIAASATELLVYGMPYQNNIEHFFASEPDLVAAAKNTFALYDNMLFDNRTCTMSVVRTAALDRVATASNAIYAKANGNMPSSFTPQRFMNRGITSCMYFDFRHYMAALCLNSDGSERFAGATQALADLDDALDAAVIYAAATPMLWNAVPLTYHCGLSTYILSSQEQASTKNYCTLDWYRNYVTNLKFE